MAAPIVWVPPVSSTTSLPAPSMSRRAREPALQALSCWRTPRSPTVDGVARCHCPLSHCTCLCARGQHTEMTSDTRRWFEDSPPRFSRRARPAGDASLPPAPARTARAQGDGAHDLWRTAQCISPGATRAGVSAFQGAAFVLGEPAKHAGLLTGPQRTPCGSQRPDTDGRWPWRHLCGAARGP